MKKVLLLTENFPPIEGGSGRWFWELYSRLSEQNVIILTHDIGGGAEFDHTHGLRVIRVPMKSTEWGLKSITGLKFYWRMVNQVRALVKQHQIDEIHCGRVIHEGVTAWLVKLLTGVPFVCFVHGEDVETAATSREQAFLVRKVCSAARLLVCNSHNSEGLVEKLGFSSREKCQVLHPGVDTERFVPAEPDDQFRQQMGWQGKQVLLTVGRLQRRKGQDYLLDALPELIRQFPNLFYAIVGKGECENELRASIKDRGLEAHARLYTDLDDVALIQCYQQCDTFILPNRTIGNDIEGFGMVLVEAQSCGKPVIAGDSGGTSETLVEGQTGYIIDCSDPKTLARTLSGILASTPLLPDPEKPRQHVLENLTWDSHLTKAKALFEM